MSKQNLLMQFSNFLINCKTGENVNYGQKDSKYHLTIFHHLIARNYANHQIYNIWEKKKVSHATCNTDIKCFIVGKIVLLHEFED